MREVTTEHTTTGVVAVIDDAHASIWVVWGPAFCRLVAIVPVSDIADFRGPRLFPAGGLTGWLESHIRPGGLTNEPLLYPGPGDLYPER